MPAVLLACEGSVTVQGAGGEREIAAADLFQDYLTTAVGDDEILTRVRLPALDGYGFGYQKFNRRQEDWAMVAVCALVKKAGDGSCEDVRIGLTHMGSTPLRATAAEEALRGGPLDADAIAAGRRAGRRGHRPARRPERLAGLQAPPRARADAGARSRRRRREAARFATPDDGRARPWPARATSPTGPRDGRLPRLDARAAAAARGRGRRRQDRGRAGAGRRDRRAR